MYASGKPENWTILHVKWSDFEDYNNPYAESFISIHFNTPKTKKELAIFLDAFLVGKRVGETHNSHLEIDESLVPVIEAVKHYSEKKSKEAFQELKDELF